MSRERTGLDKVMTFRILAVCGLLLLALTPSTSADLVVGPKLLKAEGVFTAGALTYEAPLELPAKRRLVVSVAAQYALDFGIIPKADLKKWRRLENPRFLMRLTGETNTRYITLDAGSYYVVARDLNRGTVANGYTFKIRHFTSNATDGEKKRSFISNKVMSSVVYPRSWYASEFSGSGNSKVWLDGVFSRGADRKVRWEILDESGYDKLNAGRKYSALLSGGNPKGLGLQFKPKGGPYYFVVINEGNSYSAYTLTRELYR